MQKKINTIIWIIFLSLLICFISYVIYNNNSLKVYENKSYYMDNYIYMKIYAKDNNQSEEVFKEINKIYKKYTELLDTENDYPLLNNLHYIKNNDSNLEYLVLDSKLYNLLDYCIKNKDIYNLNVEGVELKENKIKNNHVNINLESIKYGYVNNEVKEYLEKNNIKKYIISLGNNVIASFKDNNDYYKIAIEDPRFNDYSTYINLKIKNETMTTIKKDLKSLTIISNNPIYSNYMAYTLIDNDNPIDIVNNDKLIEGIYFIDIDNQIKSSNFQKYID